MSTVLTSVDGSVVTRVYPDPDGIPYPALVTNRGPSTVVIGDDVAEVDALVGYELGTSSALQWDKGRRLFMKCRPDETAQVAILDNAGSVFDAGAIAGQILDQGLAQAIAAEIYTSGAPPVDKPRPLTHAAGAADGTVHVYGAYDTSALQSIQWRWRRTDDIAASAPTSADYLIFYWLDESGTLVLGADVVNVLGDNASTSFWAQSFGRVPVRGPRLQIIVQTNDTTGGSGDPGGGGGNPDTGSGAFLLGASGVGCEGGGGQLKAWMTDTTAIRIHGSWADASVAAQTEVWAIANGGPYAWLRADSAAPKLNLAMGGPLLASGESWAAAAAGAYTSRWQASANTISSLWTRPKSHLFLDFAREMNGGTWNPWNVPTAQAANFKAAWALWAAIMRATLPGVNLMLTFNDGTGAGMATPLQLWPTAQIPDICAVDTYNAWPHVTDAAGFDAKMNQVGSGGYPIGLEKWRRQAATWGVPIALSEFANGAISTDGGGGGDHPYWTTATLNWCYANAGTGPGKVHHAIWFNHGPAEGYDRDYRVFITGTGANPAQPQTAAAFRAGHSA